jgi:hypothetical protein
MVTVCAAPGVRERVAGCAVTPVGSPVMAIITVPVNPLMGAALMLTCWPCPPGSSKRVAGVEVRVKSAGGLELPPQDNVATQTRRHESMPSALEKGFISTLPVD